MENHIKLFSGSEMLALAVKDILEQNNIEYIERNDIQSAIGIGMGILDQATHIFIESKDSEKAKNLLSEFDLKI